MPVPIDAFSYNSALDDLTQWVETQVEAVDDSPWVKALGDQIAVLRKPMREPSMNDPE